MNPTAVKKTNTAPLRRMIGIQADANNQLPARIQIIRAGEWTDSVKGNLIITTADLAEMKYNFDRGLAQSQDTNGNYIGLPIDFSHNSSGIAGAWIKALELDGDILWASVEYTDAGKQALLSGEFKCISPSFYPSCLGWWYDPEDPSISAQNVLVGAGFTNIPFFKDLVAIMASTDSRDGVSGKSNIIYADVKGEKQMPTFEEVRKKIEAGAEYTDDEKQVLADNKDKLTADELVLAGLTEKPKETEKKVNADTNKPEGTQITADQQAVLADIASGKKVLVEADAYKALESKVDASVEALKNIEREKITTAIDAHINRGAFKQDQRDDMIKRVEADASFMTFLDTLKSDPTINASEKGSDKVEGSAEANIEAKVEAAMKENDKLTYSQALVQVATEDADLAKARETELKTA